jgi:hypothetical protein
MTTLQLSPQCSLRDELRAKIQQAIKDGDETLVLADLPELPPKSTTQQMLLGSGSPLKVLMGRAKLDIVEEEFLEQRREGLQHFVVELLSNQNFFKIKVVRDFLGLTSFQKKVEGKTQSGFPSCLNLTLARFIHRSCVMLVA